MLSTQVRANWPFHLEEVRNRFLRWPLWPLSWLSDWKDFIYLFFLFFFFLSPNKWMDGYFVYRRSTLKGHIASNKFYVI